MHVESNICPTKNKAQLLLWRVLEKKDPYFLRDHLNGATEKHPRFEVCIPP